MKVLVTTHAQMFRTPGGEVWTNSVYDYSFFKRYLDVFEEVRLVTRMKDITYEEVGNRIRVDGRGMEFFPLPFYQGPWQYLINSKKIQNLLSESIKGTHCAILRIPDQLGFQLFSKIKKAGVPCAVEVVAHSWDFYAPGTIGTKLRPFLRVLWDLLQKSICKKADGVAYVTENYIQKRYPSDIAKNKTGRFETHYTSADLNNVFFDEPRNKSNFQKKKMSFVHVAGINNSAKGHYELLHALHLLKSKGEKFETIFVGDGTQLVKYKNLRDELNLQNEVEFIGSLSDPKEIAEVLKRSDIFIFPTLTEGLPRVILEAMAAGLPCIATNVGGIPELLSSRCLVESNNVNSLKNKILELSNDIVALEEESYKNYEKAVESFSPSKIQQKRRVFYHSLKNLV